MVRVCPAGSRETYDSADGAGGAPGGSRPCRSRESGRHIAGARLCDWRVCMRRSLKYCWVVVESVDAVTVVTVAIVANVASVQVAPAGAPGRGGGESRTFELAAVRGAAHDQTAFDDVEVGRLVQCDAVLVVACGRCKQ